ncbi:MAG: AAA family ATPase, partial [Pseudomonadota bacterium]
AVRITQDDDGRLALNGPGEVVEWAVLMRRYPEADVLVNVARKGDFSLSLANLLGEKIAQVHGDLTPIFPGEGRERFGDIVRSVSDRLQEPHLGLPKPLTDQFATSANHSHGLLRSKLETRFHEGLVRRCHGDMHLANLILLDGEPVPVDALEFDERLAEIDVLYDLAFLLMDLLHNGLKAQANHVLNRYCLRGWSLIETHGFEVLPLFVSLRAAVRSMVEAQRVATDDQHNTQDEPAASEYLQHACEYLQQQSPQLLAVGGLSGTGKSTLAAELAPKIPGNLGALVLRSDLERKAMFGVDEYAQLPSDAYTKAVSADVYARLFEKARIALQQGQPVILDGVFAGMEEQVTAADVALAMKVPFYGLWLTAPLPVLVERVQKRRNDASDADSTVVLGQQERFHDVDQHLPDGWHVVDASSTAGATLHNAISMLTA